MRTVHQVRSRLKPLSFVVYMLPVIANLNNLDEGGWNYLRSASLISEKHLPEGRVSQVPLSS